MKGLKDVLVALVALTLAACDAGQIQRPEPPASARAQAASSEILARFVDGAPAITIGYAKKTIGPEGGSLRLLDYEVVVPAGAVEKATEFMIRLPVDPQDREYVMAEFHPHGAQFLAPVLLRFPLAGTTIEGDSAASVVWWDGSAWTGLSSRWIEDGARIEAPTDHFSTYGTSTEASFTGELSSGG